MIWSKEETLPREEIEKLQLERLQETVHRVYNKVPAYRKKMDDAGVKPEDIKSLADLPKLPFVTKQDMRDNYPFGLFAVERDELVRIHASSGTTGKPTVVGYTQGDLESWTECVARIACMGGATAKDTAQICFGYGMFTGALGLHYGLEKIGSAIVPSSTGNSQKQIMYMQDFETSLLVATPSYALRLAEVAREMGVEPATDLKVKIALVGSELLTDAMREEMHKYWGKDMLITTNYGMSELMGPGVSGECLEHCGLHINEDYFLPEIIDPKTGEVLPAGEQGVTCHACGKQWELTPLGEMKALDGETEISHIPDWYRWERQQVRQEILDGTYRLSEDVKIAMQVDYTAIYMVGEGHLTHDASGFHLTGCGGKLDYSQKPQNSYSLYADYYWYEIADCICIGDNEVHYFCFPKDPSVSVAKLRLATEEMYKLHKEKLLPTPVAT